MRALFASLIGFVMLSGQVTSVVALDRGNTTAQEYGDAVYRELEGVAGFLGYDYNHTAIFAGFDNGHNGRVLQALGSGYVTHEEYFNYAFTSHGTYYYGAYTLSNRTMTFTDRRNVVTTAISLVNAAIAYPSTFPLFPVCIVYYGSVFDGTVADISNIRCDGFVEFCYEKNNFRVWRNQDYADSQWSIVSYPDWNNNRADSTRNPEDEASPWAQRGAPCATGPISSLGCSYLPPDTKMTSAAITNLPTYQVTTNGGPGYLDVTIQATDESGIHYIGCIIPGTSTWDFGQTQPQHPTSASYSRTVHVTTNGTLWYFARDNGGNYPPFATGYTVIVPPPDTTKPTVSITNPPSAKTYTNSQTVTISATAADNIGVANVEFYDGATFKGSDTTPAYTFDWAFTAADNGAHVWTARAYDAAGNVATSSAVTLTVSIDITPPTVVISSPANGANLTTSPTTVSGTATDPSSPSSGLNLVEVRVNGGSWSNATGTTSWTRSVTWSPCNNTLEVRSRDNAGNYSTIVSNFVTYTPPNTVPNTPSNVLPPNATTNISITLTLEASAFSDVDCIGDTHAASQWQVLNSAGAIVVADSGTDTVNRVSWLVPAAKLYYGSNYQWRVRYQDSRSGWSSYSAPTTFSTGGPLLSGAKQGTNMVFTWPTNTLGFSLQWVTNLGLANWSNATPPPVIVSGQYTVTNSMTNNAKFYRLKK
jgi:hypothetical protein